MAEVDDGWRDVATRFDTFDPDHHYGRMELVVPMGSEHLRWHVGDWMRTEDACSRITELERKQDELVRENILLQARIRNYEDLLKQAKVE